MFKNTGKFLLFKIVHSNTFLCILGFFYIICLFVYCLGFKLNANIKVSLSFTLYFPKTSLVKPYLGKHTMNDKISKHITCWIDIKMTS